MLINTFRFVLYQLSKNLNRPFFMDLLTQLSIRFTDESRNNDYEEDPNDSGDIEYSPDTMLTIISQGIIWCPCCSNQVLPHRRVKR